MVLTHRPKEKEYSLNYKKENTEMICLQETHITEQHHKLLECKKLGKHFYSSDQEKKKRHCFIYKTK